MNEISVYLCTTKRYEFAHDIADVVAYTTCVNGFGISKQWGTEPTLIVSHFFNDDRGWSYYGDGVSKGLRDVLEAYLEETNEDAIGVMVDNGKREFYLLVLGESWLAFENHLINGLD